jgi:SAM-dependent methyltransferase
MDDGLQLDPDIAQYYSEGWDEDARLRSGLNRLEFLRTQEILRRYLEPPMRVIDIGGGSGIHAEWLLADGHSVDLIDPVSLHVEQATAAFARSGRFTARLGDGRALGGDDDAYDAALVMGPLYHLIDRSDRVRSLAEAARVVRPGGLVAAAAITRFASLFAGLEEDEIYVDEFRAVVERDLAEGQHRNVAGKDYFTTAFFHHPDELVEEAAEAGIADIEVLAVEGPLGASPQVAEAWEDPAKRDVLLDLVRRVEREPTLMGIGPHLLLVGWVPGR